MFFEYKNYKDLKGKVLQHKDHVILSGICYVIESRSLISYNLRGGDKIFKILFIKNKKKFCEKHYGYISYWHYGFPRFKFEDYEAATRVSLALMKRYERWGWFFVFLRKFKKFLKKMN